MFWKIVCLTAILSFYLTPCLANDEKPAGSNPNEEFTWALSLYSGLYTSRTFGQTTFNIPGEMEKKYMHGLGLSRKIHSFWQYFALEAEGMFVAHHGKHDHGRQNYEEYVLAILLRYDHFPWNNFLHTSLAVGDGLSWTSRLSKREVQSRGKSRQFLNYLTVELAFTLPDHPRYSLVYKIHHRSGVYGLFGGIRGASDFYVLGLRYRF
ncbi:hypothetical protein [Desulfonatronovibrio magnus]|uniref:hypothetical protein n=1 Tax=Desulfonatronovibrio magnus TaxID=698827 RepID=UPI0005EAD6E9|nr:hypothetical protein [Desulfonatronovibrio magnus]